MRSIPNFHFYSIRYQDESNSKVEEASSSFEQALVDALKLFKLCPKLDLSNSGQMNEFHSIALKADELWTSKSDDVHIETVVSNFFSKMHQSIVTCGEDKRKFCSYFKSKLNNIESLVSLGYQLYAIRRSITYTRAFQNDYDRIVSSSAFRRLQDKAQVFSLESFDFVRTRLTHSNEVSAISEQLVSKMLFDAIVTRQNISLPLVLSDICKCVCLLHDIGNPPFGHYGESIIRRFFGEMFSESSTFSVSDSVANAIGSKKTRVADIITREQLIGDFVYFDGNAQAFRIVNHLQPYRNKSSLNLTASVLRGLLKYPCDCCSGIEKGKFGYFHSERQIIEFLKKHAGYEEGRLYLPALIMEVADDIAYNISDFEDALKKGLITYEDFANADTSKEEAYVQKFFSDFHAFYKENLENFKNPFEVTLSSLIQRLKINLISESAFILSSAKRIAWLLDRTTENRHVLDQVPSYLVCRFIKKKFIKPNVYYSRTISETELEADTILSYLLKEFTNAVLLVDFDPTQENINKIGGFSNLEEIKYRKIINLISPHILKAYSDIPKDSLSAEENLYYRLRIVVDYISGMTDSFAKRIYSKLVGK